MKKHFPSVLGLILVLTSVCLAQEVTPAPSPAAKPRPAMSKAQVQKNLIAAEKKLWEAFKNKDAKPFKTALSSGFIMVGDAGVSGKEDVLKDIAGSDCDVKSYALSDFKLSWLDSSTAVLTYKSTQDGTCGGMALPATAWSSSTWVRQGGKWYAATHQETPAKQ